ncbi:MAG TPA: hypothetical protein VGF12_07175 [Roseateles sp.]|uniref:hypothetical protein n=1 Tax=Roseateles sp. TaxID=1971397 RepID=UPI002ED96472
MPEVTDIATIPTADLITSNEAVLKAAIEGIGKVIILRPESLMLAQTGMRVQSIIDTISVDLEIAGTLTIDSPEMLEEATAIAGRLAMACADSGAIEMERKALVSPFNDLVKKVNEGYGAPRTFVANVLAGVKSKILAYNAEQRRIAAEKEAEAAAERQLLAREAADREAQANRDAQALVQQAQEAQAAGSEITAGALLQQASVKVDEARQQADVAVTAMHTRATVAPIAAAKGVRGKWTGEVTNKAALIQHIAAQLASGDESLLHLLDVNPSNLNKLADMQKSGLKLPGTKPVFTESLSVRKVA